MSSLSQSYYNSSRRDTPTDVDAVTQTTEIMRSVIYDESYITDDEGIPYDIDEEEESESDDESNKPPYLQRAKGKGSEVTNEKQRQMTMALLRGGTTFINEPVVAKWKPKKIDYNGWRNVNLDNNYGTYYSYKPETVASPDELPVIVSKSREPAEGHLFGGLDCFHMREKSYIRRVKEVVPRSPFPGKTERKRFSSHIIQEYKRPLKDIKPNGYGTPRSVAHSQGYDGVNDVVDSLIKPNIGYNVMPKRQNPEKCDRPNVIACQFCDVLGPAACGMCIEATNRRISLEVEEAAFPPIDCSATSLVAPSLSKTMTMGDRLMKNIRVSSSISQATDINPLSVKTSFALPPIIAKRPVPNASNKDNDTNKKVGRMGLRFSKAEKGKTGKRVSLPPITRSHKMDIRPIERRNTMKKGVII